VGKLRNEDEKFEWIRFEKGERVWLKVKGLLRVVVVGIRTIIRRSKGLTQ